MPFSCRATWKDGADFNSPSLNAARIWLISFPPMPFSRKAASNDSNAAAWSFPDSGSVSFNSPSTGPFSVLSRLLIAKCIMLRNAAGISLPSSCRSSIFSAIFSVGAWAPAMVFCFCSNFSHFPISRCFAFFKAAKSAFSIDKKWLPPVSSVFSPFFTPPCPIFSISWEIPDCLLLPAAEFVCRGSITVIVCIACIAYLLSLPVR